jgi:Flp pilus assembly protein TadD
MLFGCTTGEQEIPEPRSTTPNFAEEANLMTASGHYDAYTAFSEGMRLLSDGNAHAAVIALEQARQLEPAKSSVREALARAYFRTGRFAAAEQEFIATLDIEPVNDYAQYGVGLCRLKAGDRARARGHLRLATVMRPDNADYQAALEQVIDTDVDADTHGPSDEEQQES